MLAFLILMKQNIDFFYSGVYPLPFEGWVGGLVPLVTFYRSCQNKTEETQMWCDFDNSLSLPAAVSHCYCAL